MQAAKDFQTREAARFALAFWHPAELHRQRHQAQRESDPDESVHSGDAARFPVGLVTLSKAQYQSGQSGAEDLRQPFLDRLQRERHAASRRFHRRSDRGEGDRHRERLPAENQQGGHNRGPRGGNAQKEGVAAQGQQGKE